MLHRIAPLNRAGLVAAVGSIEAQGLTPIARSLALAGGDFPRALKRGHIILVTDGEETCGGNPIAVAEALQSNSPPVRVHVLGFGVAAADQTSLPAIARAGGGVYRDVASEADLRDAFGQLIESIVVD